MPRTAEPWFVGERSEAMAAMMLTSRNDVRICHEHKGDEGIDFLVEIEPNGALTTRWFVVQVKGTLSTEQSRWTENVRPLFQVTNKELHVPACVFVFNVRDGNGHYSWVAEPAIQEGQAILKFHQSASFEPLTENAIGEIIRRVKAWYDVLPQQLLPKRD